MPPDKLPKIVKILTPLTACLVLMCAVAAHAASGSSQLNTLLHRLQRHYQETTSFSAKFKEEISPAGGMKRQRDGTVYYRKPGRMRWDFAGQDAEVIVSDGTQLYTYQPDLNQVIETPLAQAFRSSSAASFLLGVGSVERDFDASFPPSAPADGLKHVTLKPKAGGDMIEMGLDPATLDIRTLRLTDQLGDVTYLTFSDVKMGGAIDEKLFVFTPPPGADIVKAPPPPAAASTPR
jgi:outer membrane lipoprotein carrier protein